MTFSNFTLTEAGQALMAKLILSQTTAEFTYIKTSSHVYTASQLAALTDLEDIKQSAPVSRVDVVNATTVRIQGSVNNEGLAQGYYINTVGVYADDPDDGEILYCVGLGVNPAFIPPADAEAVSGASFSFKVMVGNAESVDVTVDPAGYATMQDILTLDSQKANVPQKISVSIGVNDWQAVTGGFAYVVSNSHVTANTMVMIPEIYEDQLDNVIYCDTATGTITFSTAVKPSATVAFDCILFETTT